MGFQIHLARAIRLAGYGAAFTIGLTLWPRLMELGFKHENTNFGLAILLGWFCLPVSMVIAGVTGWVSVRVAHAIDPMSSGGDYRRNVQLAQLLGVLATLGSCGMIASGYEPPDPFGSIYELDLSGKYR